MLVQFNKNTAKNISSGKSSAQKAVDEGVKNEIIRKATKKILKNQGEQAAASASAYFIVKSGVAPDVSFDTRIKVEWPRAIAAFKANPIIGTGPSSITEATDGDYFRWLGETGLLGFISFIYILLLLVYKIFIGAKGFSSYLLPLLYAPLFSLFGLLINAGYFDIFEASKIALIFWFIFGIWIGLIDNTLDKIKSTSQDVS